MRVPINISNMQDEDIRQTAVFLSRNEEQKLRMAQKALFVACVD
jgi:hypothetical protein